jgi:trans-aconitate 2-methyltransferase
VSTCGPRDWDGATYDRVSDPQLEWARPVLDRLPLRGSETVLDAGCGSGRVTELLLERLPRGRVLAVDGAPGMVREARRRLAGKSATVLESDLTELSLDHPVEAVFSTAVFHWIADHDRLFARLRDALRPDGYLTAQCGGYGNVDRFLALAREVASREPFAAHLAGWDGPWNFATAEDTAARLEAAGFDRVDCWLEPRPTRPPEPVEFIRTVCLGHHLDALPADLRDPYVVAVAEACGDPMELDYMRLNIDARRRH